MRRVLGRRQRARAAQRGRVLAEIERHPLEPRADPDDLAGRAELVELRGLVAGHAARQDVRFPERRGEREPLERDERLAQRRAAVDALPRGKEACERGLPGRLHLAAKTSEGGPAQAAQDVRVAPLALGSAGPQLAAHEPVRGLEPHELRLGLRAEARRPPRRS